MYIYIYIYTPICKHMHDRNNKQTKWFGSVSRIVIILFPWLALRPARRPQSQEQLFTSEARCSNSTWNFLWIWGGLLECHRFNNAVWILNGYEFNCGILKPVKVEMSSLSTSTRYGRIRL